LALLPSCDSYTDSTIIWDVMPCNLVEVGLSFALYLFLAYHVSHPEDVGSSETSVNFYGTTRRHIFGHRYEKFVCNIIIILFYFYASGEGWNRTRDVANYRLV
jgi:hypothetical protein